MRSDINSRKNQLDLNEALDKFIDSSSTQNQSQQVCINSTSNRKENMIFKINKAKESYSNMSKGKFNQVLNRMKDKENIAKNKIHVMKKAKRFKDENNYQNFIKSNVSNGKLSQKDINSMIYRFEKDALRRSRTKEKLEMMKEEKIAKEISDMFKPNLTKYYSNSNRLNRNSQDSHSLKHKNLSN